MDRFNKLEKDGLFGSLTSESYPIFKSYLQRKMAKLSFIGHGERATKILALVHINMCSPFNVQARGGYLYFIIFTDDFSRYDFVYLMHHKYDAFEKFKEFRCEVEKQFKNTHKGSSIRSRRRIP